MSIINRKPRPGYVGLPLATDIKLERDKAERMVTQVLREEQRIAPADANALAEKICNRLVCATPETGFSCERCDMPDGHFLGRTFR